MRTKLLNVKITFWAMSILLTLMIVGEVNWPLQAQNVNGTIYLPLISNSNQQPANDNQWKTFETTRYGYDIQYPASLTPIEKRDQTLADPRGVPSDLWFGTYIHVITRIPALSDELVSEVWGNATTINISKNLRALRVERSFAPIEAEGKLLSSIEYLIRQNGVDFILIYDRIDFSDPIQVAEFKLFEKMIGSFQVYSQRDYSVSQVFAAASVVDGFDFPVDKPDGSSNHPNGHFGYNVTGNGAITTTCFGKPMWELVHAGEDWMRKAKTPVYATADGTIQFSKDQKYPGGVIIIRHQLSAGISTPWNNNVIYSVYSHLDPNNLPTYVDVRRGDLIGTLVDQGDNSHLHFEIRRDESMNHGINCFNSIPGPGYVDTGENADSYGYTNPENWISEHRPLDNLTLFDQANYDVGGSTRQVLDPGKYNLDSFNDKTSSISIPSGWSIKVYEDANPSGGTGYAVFNKSIANLADLLFQFDLFCPQTPHRIDNAISAIEVFDHPLVFSNVSASAHQAINATWCSGPAPSPPPPPSNPSPTPLPTAAPPPSGDGIQVVSVSSHSVSPGEKFNPSITIKVVSGSLLVSRGDHLHAMPEDTTNTNGAWPVQAVKSNVGTGGTYTFDVNNDSGFQMTAPTTPGSYVSKWQLRVGGNYIGPVIQIPITVGSVAPPPKPSGWHVQYWNGYYNNNPWGNSRCKGDDYTDSIPFTKKWGSSGPGSGCSGDQFSVLFERYFDFSGGHYRFHCHRDSYCRIFINGTNLDHAEEGAGFGGMDWGVDIPQGHWEVKIEYSHRRENGDSRLEFWWQGPESYLPPLDVNCDASPYEWCGKYRVAFDSPSDSYMLKRFEGTGYLDHNWGSDSPGYGIYNDFSAEWSRKAKFDSGLYRFYANHDDGVRINLDNSLILDKWGNCCTTDSAEQWITAGDHQIYVNWFDGGGGANIKVWWEKVTDCYSLGWTSTITSAGIVSITPAPNCPADGGKYMAGTSVSLNAVSLGGSQFVGWTGDAYDTTQTITLVMNANKNVAAHFVPCYTLQVGQPVGGVITVNPPADCNNGTQYKASTNVALYAYPFSNYSFSNWGGALSGGTNPSVITMSSNQAVNASFVAVPPTDTPTPTNTATATETPTATPTETTEATPTPTIMDSVPSIPFNLSPADGTAFHESDTIMLSWSHSENSNSFQVEVFGGQFSAAPWRTHPNQSRVTLPSLQPGHYTYHVEAYNAQGAWSGWSVLLAFEVMPSTGTTIPTAVISPTHPVATNTPTPTNTTTISPTNTATATPYRPANPTNLLPPNGSTFTEGETITLSWNHSANSVKYHVEVFGPQFTATPWKAELTQSLVVLPRLSVGNYTYHVEAYNSEGWYSNWSELVAFEVLGNRPTDDPTITPTHTPTPVPSVARLQGDGATNGAPQSRFIFVGSGFPFNQQLPVYLTLANAAVAGSSLISIGTVTTDSNGNFDLTVATVSNTSPGEYTLSVGDNPQVSASFTIATTSQLQQPPARGVTVQVPLTFNQQRIYLPVVTR